MNVTRWIAALLICSYVIASSAPRTWAEDTAQAGDAGGGGATAAAVVSDILYVPGKAIVCGVSGVLWLTAMALTFGALYQESAEFVKGGCGGKWVLTGEDIKPQKPSY